MLKRHLVRFQRQLLLAAVVRSPVLRLLRWHDGIVRDVVLVDRVVLFFLVGEATSHPIIWINVGLSKIGHCPHLQLFYFISLDSKFHEFRYTFLTTQLTHRPPISISHRQTAPHLLVRHTQRILVTINNRLVQF